jgi:hypothetical protein
MPPEQTNDFSIYVRSKQAARRVGNSIYVFLRDVLCLPINREKSGIRRPSTFNILGYHFVPVFKKGVKGQYQLVVSRKSWQSFTYKLKELTRKTIPISFTERIRRLNRLIRGWRVAQNPILKTTITLARLKKRGYIAMLELYHQNRPT